MNLPEPGAVERIGVLGTGTIGASWAAMFLACGKQVTASDPAPDAEAKLRAYVDQIAPDLQRLGFGAADQARLSFDSDPAAAVRDVQFVQESAPSARRSNVSSMARSNPACRPMRCSAPARRGC